MNFSVFPSALSRPSPALYQVSSSNLLPDGIDEPIWSTAKRIGFRFVFVYLFLYIFPFPLTAIPFGNVITQPYTDLWDTVVPWVGERVFDVEATVHVTGSGDKVFDYVHLFCLFVLTAATTVVWSVFDRKRLSYSRLHDWLRTYVRFFVGFAMIGYGAYKVIKSQFPDPSLEVLTQTFGDASPMRLVWTFMGASTGYNLFTGGAEVLGGLLLTMRRTTLLGALVTIGVMANVAMLNFCYDVPVKLFSTHLLVMAAFLAASDLLRLANFLVLNRPTAPSVMRPLFTTVWLHWTVIGVRTFFVLGIVLIELGQSFAGSMMYGDLSAKPPLYGIWNAEEVVVDGEVRPPLLTDDSRWRRAIFSRPGMVTIQLMNDSRQRFLLTLDEEKRTLTLTKGDDSDWKVTLNYREEQPGYLVLEGIVAGKTVRITLRRFDETQFLLVNRGFNWINEVPYNR